MHRRIAALALFLAASPAAAQGTGGSALSPAVAASEAQIRRTLADFEAAWNAHDPQAFARAFAEDADFTNVRGVGAHGRAAIEAFHAPLFATRFRDSNQHLAASTIRFVRPDVAAVDVRWTMTGARGPDGQAAAPRAGLLNLVMTPTGDRWLVTVMHNMDVPAAP